jgi:hypothetical protein
MPSSTDTQEPAGRPAELLQSRREPGPRRLPVALDRNDRHLQDFGDVLFSQAAEESQLDDTGSTGIRGSERRQERVQVEELFARDGRAPPIHFRKRHAPLLATAFVRDAGARMIDENAPHRLRRDGEEVGAILVGNGVTADETQIELVDDRIGFKGVVVTLTPQKAGGLRAQLRLDDREELVAGALVPGPPAAEPAGNLRRFGNLCHKRPCGMILTPAVVRYRE